MAVSSSGSFLTFLVLVFDLNQSYGAWAIPLLLLANFIPGLVAPSVLRWLAQRGTSLPSIVMLQVVLSGVTLIFGLLYRSQAWVTMGYMLVIASLKSLAEPQLMSAIANNWDTSLRTRLFGNLEVIGAVTGAAVPVMGLSARSLWGTQTVLIVDAATYLVAGALFYLVLNRRESDVENRAAAAASSNESTNDSPRVWQLLAGVPPLRLLVLATAVAAWVNVTEFGVFEYRDLSETWVAVMLTAWAVGSMFAVIYLRVMGDRVVNVGVVVFALVLTTAFYVLLPSTVSVAVFVLAGFSSAVVLAASKSAVQTRITEIGVSDQTIFWALFGRLRAILTLGSIGLGLAMLHNGLSPEEAFAIAAVPVVGFIAAVVPRGDSAVPDTKSSVL